jgi:hypothetical protein
MLSKVYHLNLNRALIFKSNARIVKLSQIFTINPATNLNIYKLANALNKPHVQKAFCIDSALNGILMTSQNIDDVNALIELNTLEINIEINTDIYKLYLHLLNNTQLANTANNNNNNNNNKKQLNALHSSLNGKLFELDLTREYSKINLNTLNCSNLKFNLINYEYIDLTSSSHTNGRLTSTKTAFKIENSTFLTFDRTRVTHNCFYLILVKFCLQLNRDAKSEASNANVSECSQAKFNLKLKSTQSDAKFMRDSFTFCLVQIERKFYLQNNKQLVRLYEFQPFINLKQLTMPPPNHRWSNFKATSLQENFYLDQRNGLVYAAKGLDLNATHFDVFLVNTAPNTIESRARIYLEKLIIPNRVHIQINNSNHCRSVLKLDNDIELIKCSMHRGLFRLENNKILLNTSLAYETLFKRNLFHVNEFDINIDVKLAENISFKLQLIITCDQYFPRQISTPKLDLTLKRLPSYDANFKVKKFKSYLLVENVTLIDINLSSFIKEQQQQSEIYLLSQAKSTSSHWDLSEYFYLNEINGHLEFKQPAHLKNLIDMNVDEFNHGELFGNVLNFVVFKVDFNRVLHKITNLIQLEVSLFL